MPRSRKRLTELMLKTALDPPSPEDAERWSSAKKEFHLTFLRSPLKFMPAGDTSRLGAVQFAINRLDNGGVKAVPTGETEELECGLVLRSIGYKSHAIDGQMPFDLGTGVVPNKVGRVTDFNDLYCSGWVKRGPVGVLATTMNDAFETGKNIVEDLLSGFLSQQQKTGRDQVLDALKGKGVDVVSFTDWERIDDEEKKRGMPKGKPREKIINIAEMLSVAEK